jgi:hypothetical protein
VSDWVVKVLKSGNEKSPVRTMVTLLAQLRFRLSVSRNKRRKVEDGYKRMFPVYMAEGWWIGDEYAAHNCCST